MSIFKCKMCGGTIEFNPGDTVGVCDSCGTKQTLPTTNDEIITNLHNRANTLRLKCEFDKTEEIYNKILEKNPDDAEAHWGIILCKYGIEYVEDPKTYNRVPTCHRTSFDAILADEDYKAALANGDGAQRELYEEEAKKIDRIQKDILSIVHNEKPFDVFICYKETDENGNRTQDSVIANDIYHQLTQEGFKVFYAAITLEDKVGQEYEPYIFAALNSAKVMLVVGSKPEYFTAVWVKNEWSRFLKLIKTDRSKLLIPCYRNMDAYELPEEFAHLQAQDMSKIGFINDLVRGIRKVVADTDSQEKTVRESVAVNSGNANEESLLKRAFMFLEDGDWSAADEYCEKVLDIDPENARAYLGKLMAECRACRMEDLQNCRQPFDGSGNYNKILRFAEPKLIETLKGYIAHINERNEHDRLERERKAEEERLEQERKAEEERLERERKAEEERLEQERKAEEDRLERERKAEEERLEQERKYRTNIICSAIVIIFEIAFCIVFVGGGYFADLASIGSSPVPNLILAGIILSNSLISAVITRKCNLKFVVYAAPTISSIMAFVSYLLMWFGSRSNGIFAQIFEFIIYTIFFGGIALLISFLCFKLTWIINKEIK
jgi:tetratricopeptide (TPR) repeat protein